jgi:mono/diheme cytochrome c family protein
MSFCIGATPWIGAGVPALLGLSLFACSATKLGATDVDLARARDQAAQGAAIFSQECARCHGERGEGLAGAGPILGPGALPEFPRDTSGPSAMMTDPQQLQIQTQTRPAGAPWRDPFRNAQDLYDFTVGHMPKARAAAVKPDDYWAVVTFMVAVQGGQVPSGGINAANARSIPVPRR